MTIFALAAAGAFIQLVAAVKMGKVNFNELLNCTAFLLFVFLFSDTMSK